MPLSTLRSAEEALYSREIEAELQALGYEYQWQWKRWHVWCDSRQLSTFSSNLHEADRPAEDPSAPQRANGSRQPGAPTLGDFME